MGIPTKGCIDIKKVLLQLNAATSVQKAQLALHALSGVMVTDVHGDTLTVYYGERFHKDALIRTLNDNGCTVIEHPRDYPNI